jgi:hypothetical protein
MSKSYRVSEGDEFSEAIGKMADGNLGAAVAMIEIGNAAEKSGSNPVVPLIQMSKVGLRGSSIWMLYKDVCAKDPDRVVDILQRWEMGEISIEKLHHAINNRGEGLGTDGRGQSSGSLKSPGVVLDDCRGGQKADGMAC